MKADAAWLALLVLVVSASGCQGEGSAAHVSAGPKATEPAAAGSDAAVGTDDAAEPAEAAGSDAAVGTDTELGTELSPEASAACPLDTDPRDQPDCVRDENGLFVDSRGSDANPGTKAAPLKTIGAALAKADGRPHVFVCRGIYAESVMLTRAVSLHGGFECDSWKYSGGLGVAVMPEVAGQVAVHLDGVHGALLSDLSFIAALGTAQARSSVAAFVARSSAVVLRRVLLQAQRGADGADGARGVAGRHDQNPDGLSSNSNTEGAPQRICTCSSGGITIGGAGGDGGGSSSNDGASGTPATAIAVPAEAQGAGQSALQCAQGDSRHMHGSAGAPGSDGLGTSLLGYLDAEHGFVPADGAVGGPGLPGQGGGGGAGSSIDPGGGGAGGCGGCGASGSIGGQGGGASLGLLVIDAEVRVEASVVTTAKAGDGGRGLDGTRGGAGGGGGSGFGQGCSGGRGGDGGNGGASAGGAGGVSIGIAFRGAGPTLDAATRASIKVGAAGALGLGGAPGFNDGATGLSAALSAL